jgi:hypothetical protein
MRLGRQAITGRAFAAARWDACFGALLYVGCHLRLRRTLKTLWAVRTLGPIRPLGPV